MPSRRFHKKSRFGCSQCKGRKVKCDETRPSCGNCSRTSVSCVYPKRKPSSSASPATSPEEVAAAASAASYPTPSSPSQPSASISPLGSSTLRPSFDLIDLALMSHFTAVTSLNLFAGERQRQIWQRELPSQAGSNAMLMHGLLAVAALHQARLEPQETSLYRTRALYHHGLGLQLFNAQIPHLSSENSDVLFAFAIMLVIWVYALPAGDGEPLLLDDILDMLDIVRGCKTVFKLHMDAILDKPIGKFVDLPPPLAPPTRSPPAHQAIQHLRERAADSIHATAIDQLQRSLQRYIEGSDNTKNGTAWPAIVHDAFWARLKSHEPVAVLTFAHYAILLRCYEDRWWWMAGWAERVIQAAGDVLSRSQKATFGWDLCSTRIRTEGLELGSLGSPGTGLAT